MKTLKVFLLLLLLAGELKLPQPVSVETIYPPQLAAIKTNLLCSPCPDGLLHAQQLNSGTTLLTAVCVILVRRLYQAADLGMPVEEVLLQIYRRHRYTLM